MGSDYRADAGRYPARLADLAPKYLAAVPDDLFAGRPVILKTLSTAVTMAVLIAAAAVSWMFMPEGLYFPALIASWPCRRRF